MYDTKNLVGGPWSASPDPWMVAPECRTQSQYLNNTHPSPSEWTCVDCLRGAKCRIDSSLRVPEVEVGYWRGNPSSANFDRHRHYPCPNPSACVGGKNKTGRCAAGYDSKNGPLCAVCAPGYVKRGQTCAFCLTTNQPTTTSSSEATPALIGVYVAMITITFIILTVGIYCADHQNHVHSGTKSKSNDVSTRGIAGRNEKTASRNNDVSDVYRVEKKYMMVVAIDEYEDPENPSTKWPKLKGCEADAKAMEKVLKKQHGFITTPLLRLYNNMATLENIRAGFEWLQDHMHPNDQLIVFFAGHGEEKTGFVCYNENKHFNDRVVYNKLYSTYLSDIDTDHVLVVIDTCHAGTAMQPGVVETRLKVHSDPHEMEKAKHVMTAVTADEVALEYNIDREKKRGLFTHFFLQAIDTNIRTNVKDVAFRPRATKVAASAVHARILDRVFEESDRQGKDQNPQFGTLIPNDRSHGQFVFYRKEAALQGASPFVSSGVHQGSSAAACGGGGTEHSTTARQHLADLHGSLGAFRYHRLVDVLVAVPNKAKALATGVLCGQLNMDEEDFAVVLEEHRHVFNVHKMASNKIHVSLVSMSYDWLRSHPRPTVTTPTESRQLKGLDNTPAATLAQTLGANAQRGHTALLAHCITHSNSSYSSQWLHHHHKERKRLLNMPVEFLSADLGHVLPKIKILVGFLQVLAYLPAVFSVPWPPVFVEWLSSLRFLSLDIFAPMLALSCNLRGGFLPIFAMHMGMIPLLFVVAILANSLVRCVNRNKHHQHTHLFQALDLIVFATYAGVCSRIFVFFRCMEVDQAWYLLADMRVRCFGDDWNTSRSLAIVCVLCLMIGIPCVYVVAMFTHRRYLHDRDEFHDKGDSSSSSLTKHLRIKDILGSVYGPYRSAFYYTDQVETLRRVLLTGGLMVLGEDSVARVFMGILVSVCWLLFVTGCHPYASKWDNTVSTLLSAQVVVTLVSGMALQLYSRQPADMRNDAYQNAAFGAFLIVSNVLCLGFAVAAVVGSVPLVQKKCCCCCRKWVMNGGSDDDESVVVLHDLTKVMPLQFTHLSVSDSDDDSSSNSRGARRSFEKNILSNDFETPKRNVDGKDGSLPTLEIMETVKDCKVLFSFGSANGGLKLAKILRTRLRQEPGWDRPSTAYIDNQDLLYRDDTKSDPCILDDGSHKLDFDGAPIIKVTNPHWAEFYYGAMTYAEVVVILWDKLWRDSKWCKGEWQLFLKHANEIYVDDQFNDQQAYSFDLVIVFDGNSRETEKVMRTLVELELPNSLLKNVQLIPAIINGKDTSITKKDLKNFVEICKKSVSSAVEERRHKEGNGERKSSMTEDERMSAHVIMYDNFWKKKALDVQVERPPGHAFWWEVPERAQGYQETVNTPEAKSRKVVHDEVVQYMTGGAEKQAPPEHR